MKPCTKYQYDIEESLRSSGTDPKTLLRSGFMIEFQQPVMVTVKEEYLVFDLVAMISAIGGTMSLCVGFSFLDLARLCLQYLEDGSYYIKAKLGNSGKNGKIETMLDQVTMEDIRKLINEDVRKLINEHKIETDEKLLELKRLLYTFKNESNKIKHRSK